MIRLINASPYKVTTGIFFFSLKIWSVSHIGLSPTLRGHANVYCSNFSAYAAMPGAVLT